MAGIKDEIEENGAIREDFGNQKGKVWKSSVILFDNGTKIEAIGSGKKSVDGSINSGGRTDAV